MQLSKLIVPITTTEFDFPGKDGFKVQLAYLTRDELMKIRKKATVTKFNKRSHTPEEEVDSDIFQDLYVKAVVKGWSGLTWKYLAQLLPIDLSLVEEDEGELEYNHDNAKEMMRNSADFDGFVSDTLAELENFTQSK